MFGNLLGIAGGFMDRKESRKNRRMAQHQFDQQMDHTVQRRVKDAVAAGVHPLFALGASSGASPTISTGGSSGGSAMGRALGGVADRIAQKKLTDAEIRRADAGARRDEAEAQYLDSERSRKSQDFMSRGHDGASVVTYPMPNPNEEDIAYGPAEFFNPQVPVSSSKGVRAGVLPKYIEYMRPDGRKMRMLNPDLNMDEIVQFDFLRNELNLHITDQLEGLANWVKAKRSSPSNREIRELERRLKAIQDNPQKVREAQILARRIKDKLITLYNKGK